MNKCPGCQRDEIHKKCPAHGTPFYMSGVPFSIRVEEFYLKLDPKCQKIFYDILTIMINDEQLKYEIPINSL